MDKEEFEKNKLDVEHQKYVLNMCYERIKSHLKTIMDLSKNWGFKQMKVSRDRHYREYNEARLKTMVLFDIFVEEWTKYSEQIKSHHDDYMKTYPKLNYS